eukprot:4479221-Amphidinium_carterae.1
MLHRKSQRQQPKVSKPFGMQSSLNQWLAVEQKMNEHRLTSALLVLIRLEAEPHECGSSLKQHLLLIIRHV